MIKQIIEELLALKRELDYLLAMLKPADKLVLVLALLMLFLAVFGVEDFSKAQMLLALWAFWQVKNTCQCQIKAYDGQGLLPLKLRRIALHYILIGLFLLSFSLIDRWLSLSSLSGAIILVCGLERFRSQS